MSTLYSFPRLRDWQLPMVRLACDQCGRKGQYRRERLLAEYDPDMTMPDLRHLLARCPRRNAPEMSCGVYYADLMRRARADDAAVTKTLAKPRSEWVIRLTGATAGQRRECAP
jgi:hypothetical protein